MPHVGLVEEQGKPLQIRKIQGLPPPHPKKKLIWIPLKSANCSAYWAARRKILATRTITPIFTHTCYNNYFKNQTEKQIQKKNIIIFCE